AGPLGAVSPPLRPSWLTAVPRITARIRSPLARASDKRLSTTRPQPSPLTNPSARSSKALLRPSGAIIPALESAIVFSGHRITFTPPARARPHSPRRKLWQARGTATSDDEQAVSTATLAPWRPRREHNR